MFSNVSDLFTADLYTKDLKKSFFIRSNRRKCLKFGKKGKYINKYFKPVFSHNNKFHKFIIINSLVLKAFKTVSLFRSSYEII